MKRLFLSIIVFLVTAQFSNTFSQSLIRSKNPIVAKVGKESIRLNEVIHFYERNNPQSDYQSDDIRDFLEAYSLYKAKILEAYASGLHNEETFIQEINDFDQKAAPAYWIEKSLKEQLLSEFLERSKTEYLVSHVLVRLDNNATPSDTLQAYQTLLKAREEFLSGSSMDSLNIKYSSRIRNNPMGGRIPWFSVGATVYEFENAVYSLQPGEISGPIKSQFGYHLIHVEDQKPRTAGFYVSHIYFRNDSVSQLRVDSAFNELISGTEWSDVVYKYSDDRQSAINGGSIGLVGNNLRYPLEFSDSVLGLDTAAHWSEPIKTQYGSHIFRVDSVEQLELTSERISLLEQQLRQLPRYNLDIDDVVDRIRKSEVVYELMKNDPIVFSSDSLIKESLGSITATLFPEYAETQSQFFNGLLVFKLNEMNIWDPASVDTMRVREYFDINRDQYIAPNSSSTADPSSDVAQDSTLSDDQLFDQVFFRVFSDMQSILEDEFHNTMKDKFKIRLYPNRIR